MMKQIEIVLIGSLLVSITIGIGAQVHEFVKALQ